MINSNSAEAKREEIRTKLEEILRAKIREAALNRSLLREEIDRQDLFDAAIDCLLKEIAGIRLNCGLSNIYEILSALSRMIDGTYGICLHCGGTISGKRLDAVPQARFCINCQEEYTAGKSGFEEFEKFDDPKTLIIFNGRTFIY